jgi:hypothetical protein
LHWRSKFSCCCLHHKLWSRSSIPPIISCKKKTDHINIYIFHKCINAALELLSETLPHRKTLFLSLYSDWAVGWMITVWFPIRVEIFSLHQCVWAGPGAHLASYPMGARLLTLEVGQLGREAGHLLSLGAGVGNAWRYISTPHLSSWCGSWLGMGCVFVAWCLVGHVDGFTFCLYTITLPSKAL